MECAGLPGGLTLAQVPNLFPQSLSTCTFLCVCTSALTRTWNPSLAVERQRRRVSWGPTERARSACAEAGDGHSVEQGPKTRSECH